MVFGVKVYKRFISPFLHAAFGPMGGCRFQPTCSEYAEEAFRKHGILYGGALSVWRLLRCQPLCKGGLDLVPNKTKFNLEKNVKETVYG